MPKRNENSIHVALLVSHLARELSSWRQAAGQAAVAAEPVAEAHA